MAKFQSVCLISVGAEGAMGSRIYESFPVVLGRSPENQIGIVDIGISRTHLEIAVKNGKITIKDLGSSNGTYLRGEKIPVQVSTPYKPGDLIELGSNKIPLTIQIFEKAFETTQVKTANLSGEELQEVSSLVLAARAEARRLTDLLLAQQELAEAASKKHYKEVVASAQAKAEELLGAAAAQAEEVIQQGQNEKIQTIQGAAKDARYQADLVIQQANLEAQAIAKNLIESGQFEAARLKTEALADVEKQMDEGLELLARTRESAEQELALLESKMRTAVEAERAQILSVAEHQVARQLQQAQEQGEVEVQRLTEQTAAVLQEQRETANRQIALETSLILELKNETTRLHSEIVHAYQLEVERGEEAAQELRRQTEEEISARANQSQELLKTAVEKSARMLADAERTSTESLLNSERKSAAILRVAQDESSSLLAKTQLDIVAQFEAHQAELKQLREKTQDELAIVQAETLAASKELEILEIKIAETSPDLDLLQKKLTEVSQDLVQKEQMAAALSQSFSSAEAALNAAENNKNQLAREIVDAQKHLADLVMSQNARQQDFESRHKKQEAELTESAAQVRDELTAYRTKEMEQIDRIKLQELQELSELRLAEGKRIDRHRGEIISELLKTVEAHFLNHLRSHLPPNYKWDDVSKPLHQEVRAQLEETVYLLSRKEHGVAEEVQMTKSQAKIALRWKRAAAGVAALFAALLIIPWTRAPIMTVIGLHSVENASQQFSKEMSAERDRRYQPEKTRSWKDNYTDLVLYTEGYTQMKLDEKSQDKWISDLHKYLYKKLRVDEDSIVKIVSLEAALVSSLSEQAGQIHPDYVTEKTAKMRQTEGENVKELIKFIGGQTNYDQFQKFSQDYYYNEYLLRLPAANSEKPKSEQTPDSTDESSSLNEGI